MTIVTVPYVTHQPDFGPSNTVLLFGFCLLVGGVIALALSTRKYFQSILAFVGLGASIVGVLIALTGALIVAPAAVVEAQRLQLGEEQRAQTQAVEQAFPGLPHSEPQVNPENLAAGAEFTVSDTSDPHLVTVRLTAKTDDVREYDVSYK